MQNHNIVAEKPKVDPIEQFSTVTPQAAKAILRTAMEILFQEVEPFAAAMMPLHITMFVSDIYQIKTRFKNPRLYEENGSKAQNA